MKAAVHGLRRSAKVWLFAGIIVAAMLAVTGDRTPATAATTEIGQTLSATGTSGCGSVCAPAWVSSVTLVKGGHMTGASTLQTAMTASAPSTVNLQAGDGALFPASFEVTIGSEIIAISARSGDTLTIGGRGQEGTTAAAHAIGDAIAIHVSPCSATSIDPATSCVYIWAKNVDATSTGTSAFQIEVTYDSSKIHVAALTGSTIWLNSAGRGGGCQAAVIEEDPGIGSGHAATACTTLGSTGAGPKCSAHCNGLLAILQLESVPGAPVGQSFTIDSSNGPLGGSFLLDLTCADQHCGQQMPATVHSMNVRFVKCGNVVGTPINDPYHRVQVDDLVYLVNRYRTHGLVASTLQTDMTDSAPSTIDLQAGDGAQLSTSFEVTIGSEIIAISGRSGDTLTIGGRGQEGTAPAAHAIGDAIMVPASPNWDEGADLNASNQVAIDDIVFAVNQYRKSCLP